jgi:hypothetical protein
MNEQGECRLFKLPQELRDEIYREVLGRGLSKEISWRRKDSPHILPPLLQTCKRIRQEAGGKLFFRDEGTHYTFTIVLNYGRCDASRNHWVSCCCSAAMKTPLRILVLMAIL